MELCNLDYLKSITPNDNAFAVQVLELFLQEMPATLVLMKTALATADWSMLYREAHRIKPSVQLIGVPDSVMETLVRIIEAAKAGLATSELPGLIAVFDEQLQRIYPQLEAALAEMKA